jgi:hypothetical protein
MPIKSFKGKMNSGQQVRIRLSTNNGMRGWRIVKLAAFPNLPGMSNYETLFSVFKTEQDAPSPDTPTANFDDALLLGVVWLEGASSNTNTDTYHVIFDREIVNQDIYVTMTDTGGTSVESNYYIELEQVPLNTNSQAVATLRDIRANTS